MSVQLCQCSAGLIPVHRRHIPGEPEQGEDGGAGDEVLLFHNVLLGWGSADAGLQPVVKEVAIRARARI